MTVLTQAIAIGDNEIHIDSALAAGQVPGFVKIDDELLNVGGQDNLAGKVLTLSSPAREEHDNGATVTYAGRPFDPTFKTALAGDGATEQAVMSRTVTLTDAQIKALPTTPIVLVPATETLTYDGSPTEIPFVIAVIATLSGTTAYSNLNGTIKVVLGGANDGVTLMEDELQVFGASPVGGSVQLFRSPDIAADTYYFQLQDAIADNGIRLTAANTGDFTDGNAGNSMKVTVLYTVVEL